MSALVAGDLTRAGARRAGSSRSACASAPARSSSRRRAPARVPAEEALTRAVREEVGGGLVAHSGRFLCALVPAAAGDDEFFALAERLHARVARMAGEPMPAGAGRTVAPADLRRGFHEARCALEARALAINGNGSEARRGSPRLATYRDLGSFQLLLSLQDDDALRLFCDSILGPIEESEGAYGGELMRSLEAFIECNGQWERAAKALFCHRHTLRYRIRRVEELTGQVIGFGSRSHRLLARPPWARAGSHRKELDEGRRPHRDQDGRVPRRAHAGRSARAGRARPRGVDPGRSRRGLGDQPTTSTPRRARGSCPTPRRCSRSPT